MDLWADCVSHPFPLSKEPNMLNKRPSSERTLEATLLLISLGLTCMLFWVQGYKMVVLNLFHLPVVLAAFYLGRYRAGVFALLCVLLASAVAALDLHNFAASSSPLVIGLAITVWAAVIGLNAIFVGTLSDERSRKLQELHDAYMGVLEVLSHYLKSADRSLENRSKRLAALSERVARQLRLSEREIDDIRVAALLQDMDHIEVTARVIRRAVGDLRRSDSEEEHTFHGSDLVQSLGSVLTGALPLILNLTESRDLEFSDDAMRTSALGSLWGHDHRHASRIRRVGPRPWRQRHGTGRSAADSARIWTNRTIPPYCTRWSRCWPNPVKPTLGLRRPTPSWREPRRNSGSFGATAGLPSSDIPQLVIQPPESGETAEGRSPDILAGTGSVPRPHVAS